MKKKIVLHILKSNSFSGAENVVCQIIDMFKGDSNYRMIYVSTVGPIQKILKDRKIEYFGVKEFNIKELKKIINMIEPDIIHAHDYTASIVSAMCHPNARIISHLHNNSPWIKSYGVYSFLYFLSTFFYSNIITVSNSIEEEYVFGNLIKRKISCLGNPINTDYIKEKSNEYVVRGYFDLIFLGRLTEQKNPKLLLEIIIELNKLLPNISIAVVGQGEMFDSFKGVIEEKKLQNVKMFGFVKNPYPILRASKILCLPSLWEGYGLVAIEALSLGVPVVCSGVGGLKDIVNEQCGKICAIKDEYVKEIFELLIDNSKYTNKANYSINRAKELDNISKYKKSLEAIYK